MNYKDKTDSLKAKREELVSNHQKLSEQLQQTVAGINQYSGAISILEELQSEIENKKPPEN